MSLIKCPECGREISSYASECLGCGCPMSKIQEILNSQNNKMVAEEIVPEQKKQLFLEKLSDDQKNFIISINSTLSIDYKDDNIIDLNEKDSYYSYRLFNNTEVECKFTLSDSGLLFFNSFEHGANKDFVVVTEFNKYSKGKVIRIFDKLIGKYEPSIYERVQKEKGSTKDKHYFKIFSIN